MTAERRGVLQVAGAALLWSLGGIGIKAVAEPPLKIAAYRSATAAVAPRGRHSTVTLFARFLG